MNGKKRVVQAAAAAVLLLAALQAPGHAAGDAPFMVNRLLVCQDVLAREPVGISDTFSSDTAKVFAFLEAVRIERDLDVTFVWIHGGSEMARISVPVKQGGRWRTFSSKNLYGLAGTWRVEVQDEGGNIVGTVEFEVK